MSVLAQFTGLAPMRREPRKDEAIFPEGLAMTHEIAKMPPGSDGWPTASKAFDVSELHIRRVKIVARGDDWPRTCECSDFHHAYTMSFEATPIREPQVQRLRRRRRLRGLFLS